MPFSVETVQTHRQRLFDGYDAYLTRQVEAAAYGRERFWQRDFTSVEAYLASVAPNRQRWLEFLSFAPGDWGPVTAAVEEEGETTHFRIERLWLNPFGEVFFDALRLTPRQRGGPYPVVIAQHGLDGSPEVVCGLPEVEPVYRGMGAELARRGFLVIAPRMLTFWEKRKHLHRKAVLIGVNLMGLEIFALTRLVDHLQSLSWVCGDRIGIYGLSQGGQAALWLGAADTRLAAVVVSGFFNSRTEKMIVPGGNRYVAYLDSPEDDKFYWGQLREFSDSDIASLICPRPLLIEAGTEDRAAPAELQQKEFALLEQYYREMGLQAKVRLAIFAGGHHIDGSESYAFLERWLMSD